MSGEASTAVAPTPTKDERDTLIAKKVFFAGCVFLPWMWLLLVLNYRRRYFEADCPPQLRRYLRWSLIGFLVETSILIVWIAVFQTQWQNWGSTGLNMLIYQPNTQWWLQ